MIKKNKSQKRKSEAIEYVLKQASENDVKFVRLWTGNFELIL